MATNTPLTPRQLRNRTGQLSTRQLATLSRRAVNAAVTAAQSQASTPRRCGHCGDVQPVGQSCGCFDNGGE